MANFMGESIQNSFILFPGNTSEKEILMLEFISAMNPSWTISDAGYYYYFYYLYGL